MPTGNDFVKCGDAIKMWEASATERGSEVKRLEDLLNVAKLAVLEAKREKQWAVDEYGGLILDAEQDREELLAGPEGNPETALQRCQELPLEILLRIYYAYIKQTDYKEMRDHAGCKFTLKVPWYCRDNLFHTRTEGDADQWRIDRAEDIYKETAVVLHVKAKNKPTWPIQTEDRTGGNRRRGIFHRWYAVNNEKWGRAELGTPDWPNIQPGLTHHAFHAGVEQPKASQLKKFNNINKSGVAQMWRTTPKPRHVRYEAVDITGQVIPGTAINILKKLHPDPRLRTWGDGQRRQNKRFELYRYN